MTGNINDIIYLNKFDTLDIKYNLNKSNSKWNGIDLRDTNNPITLFNTTTKNNLDSTWQNSFRAAMVSWDYYSNFTISEVSGTTDANIYAYRADVSGQAGATAWFDNKITGTDYTGFPPDNDYARSEFVFDNAAIAVYDSVSGFREYILLHEIGHALGLKGDVALPLDYTTDMTVMSYKVTNSGYQLDPVTKEYEYTDIANARFAVTPMAYDIAAMEAKYGHVAVATGDDIYSTGFNNGGNSPQLFTGAKQSSTIKDDGDGIDTFDLSGYTGAGANVNGVGITGVKIDLGEAIDANDAWLGGTGVGDGNVTVVGDEYIYIARGTKIENAIGTAKNDTINGNSSNNKIEGGDGVDTITAGTGNDILTGGLGNDKFYINTGDGIDTITDPEAGDRVYFNGTILDGTAANLGNGLYQLGDFFLQRENLDLFIATGDGGSNIIVKGFFPTGYDETTNVSKIGITIPVVISFPATTSMRNVPPSNGASVDVL